MSMSVLTAIGEWAATGKSGDPVARVADVLRLSTAKYVDKEMFDTWIKKNSNQPGKTDSAKIKRKVDSSAGKANQSRNNSNEELNAKRFLKDKTK